MIIDIVCDDSTGSGGGAYTGGTDDNGSGSTSGTFVGSGAGGSVNSGNNNPPDGSDADCKNCDTGTSFDLNTQNDLNELSAISETPIIKTRLDDYRNRVSTDALERGSEYRTHSDGTYYEHQISQDSLEFSGTRFPSPLANSKVRVHLHHDNVNADGKALAPVPSADDVFGMTDFFKEKSDLNASDSLSIVSIVVSRRDLYAFKIKDAQKVAKFKQDLERTLIVDGKSKKYKTLLEEAYVDDVEEKVIDYCQSQGGCSHTTEEAVWEVYFLEYLRKLDSGLSFFRAFYNPQTDTYDWTPLN
jgi:hypothetical protein